MSSEVTSGNLTYSSFNFNAKYIVSSNYIKEIKRLLCDTSFLNNLALLFTDYADYINGIKYYPFNVHKFCTINPNSSEIKIGNTSLDAWYVRGAFVTAIKKNVLIGQVTIPKRFNNFFDYEPYTKVELYIPYFSFITLPTNEVMGKTIYIYMSVDFDTGMGTIYIQVDGRVIMTSSTKLGIDIPMGSSNLNQIMKDNIANITKIVGGVGVAIAGEGIAKLGGLAMAGQGALKMATTSTLHYQRGTLSGGSDMLSAPSNIYAVVTRPNPVEVNSHYDHIKGKPLQETRVLSTMHGFTMVDDIHLTTLPNALDDEVKEIDSLLRKGVEL